MRARSLILLLVLVLPVTAKATAELTPIQPLIDAAEPGAILFPEPGVYAGPLILDYPITIDGRGEVTIDAGGDGSVVYIDTDGATLKNMRLTGSGKSHNDIDAGVQVRGNFNVVKDLVIDDCLFGIDLQQSEHNIVRRNRISSKPFDLGTRGDSIRLWYSFHNRIEHNDISDSRDMVVWYSADNEIRGNSQRNSRYSLHFMYSRYNLVEDNRYLGNAVGIFLMYSDGVVLRNNRIAHAAGPTGVGIGFKETSELVIEGNEILYCASGLYIDISPFQPDTENVFTGNLIAYNGIGIRFLNDWHGNIFKENRFADNLTQVFVGDGATANHNVWQGNYWSDYQGFDQDRDGIGDTPHEIWSYADRLWRDVPHAQFYKGSPMLETLDFLERLAPFSDPNLILRDETPRTRKEWEPAASLATDASQSE